MPHAVAHSFPPALAALFFVFEPRKEKPKTRAAVPRRETCLSRLNVVNTEFQLRHLIIWSSIVIHVSSESATRAGGRRDEKESVVTDAGGGAYLARTASPTGDFVAARRRRNGSSRFNQRRSSRFTSRGRLRLRGLKDQRRRRTFRQEMPGDRNRASRSRLGRSRKKRRRLEDLSWLSGLHSEFSVTVIRPDSNKRCQKNSKQGHHRQRGPPRVSCRGRGIGVDARGKPKPPGGTSFSRKKRIAPPEKSSAGERRPPRTSTRATRAALLR